MHIIPMFGTFACTSQIVLLCQPNSQFAIGLNCIIVSINIQKLSFIEADQYFVLEGMIHIICLRCHDWMVQIYSIQNGFTYNISINLFFIEAVSILCPGEHDSYNLLECHADSSKIQIADSIEKNRFEVSLRPENSYSQPQQELASEECKFNNSMKAGATTQQRSCDKLLRQSHHKHVRQYICSGEICTCSIG